jgi:hypothetical protein
MMIGAHRMGSLSPSPCTFAFVAPFEFIAAKVAKP